ncbi:MAG: TIGR04283 family arsenosugar biosynthesis glycosyltransferase [Actinomycetota bacterium]
MISIIIPVLNEQQTLSRLLPELAKRNAAHEVIIVDGGSTDGSAELAGQYGITIKAKQGRAAQMNAGAEIAQGDILLFLHADTTLPVGALPAIEQALTENSVIGGRFRVNLDDRRMRFRVIGAMINIRDGITKGFTGDQAIFVRQKTFNELGGYAAVPLTEDLDLARRLRRHGRVVRIPLAVETSARRWKENGTLRTVLLMWKIRLYYLLGVPPSRLADMYSGKGR